MVTVYTKNNCMQCKLTKRNLQENGIEYQEVNTDDDEKALDYVKSYGVKRLPSVFVGDELAFSGFSPSEIKKLKGRMG